MGARVFGSWRGGNGVCFGALNRRVDNICGGGASCVASAILCAAELLDWMKKEGDRGGQDKAEIGSPQISRYVFVCTSFFQETVCLRTGAAERLSGPFDAANRRLPTFVGETL